MQKNDFNKIIILILIIELFFILFVNKTYSPDYYAYLKRYDHSHIYLFGNPNSDFYIEHFNRRKLSEYNWLNLNLFAQDPYYSIRPQTLLKYLFSSLNSFLFFDLILFFFSHANVDFNIFLNVISTFNVLVLFFFFKKIFNLFKYSDYSYASLIIFFLFISNFFLEFYFIRIKSGLCFSFLFLSYIFFKKKIILSIILFFISCFIHPLYSVLYFFFIVIPSCVEFFKKKVIVCSIAVVTSITIPFLFYLINIYLNQSKYEINIYRLLFYTLFPLIIFVYLINNKYNFNIIKNEKFFIFIYLLFIFGTILLSLFISPGFSGQTFLRFYGFLSIPAIIYIVKINNLSKSLLYNYIVVINFLLIFRSYFFGSI